ncbi:Aminomethyltransferase, mitochondrial [Hondaea fermentalgiana]|uniref:Aminomethyltransferase n=1 Tax=Hondaea fermentalgiana TaxID=2315210 RepID=A0A2R5GCH8_9STRA|nr:Aminomethyltransferase, mitochondrial [Hondaea fermentalgiana]|eukprot:GBG28680.1 Aminomethyltransferase, mitochondrial [Hondaea fermentalgiana]
MLARALAPLAPALRRAQLQQPATRVAAQVAVRGLASDADAANTLKTAVYDKHQELGGKLVDFAGYWLPLQYPAGVKAECLHTRNEASLFDVSHMGQVRITGPDAVAFVESIVVGDIANLKSNEARLSLITNDHGGIIDDTVITRFDDFVGMVINGACKHKDLKHMHARLEDSKLDAKIEHLEDLALFALQGPKAAIVMDRLANDLTVSAMNFMEARVGKIGGVDCTLTRCGYTGEDGFEISVSNSEANKIMDLLLEQEEVAPAGLGARDTLRLEAGLCLYGNDIDETTTPVGARLVWTVSKPRCAEGGFPGAETIQAQMKDKTQKPPRVRVGLVVDGAPARSHVEIYDAEGKEAIGEITSGTFSPILGKPVAMGYVDRAFMKAGTEVTCKVRKKFVPATISKMPFLPAKYYRAP